ncbi:MAG: MetQ/NlpA family ABC transporter substrate-binding protein [Spirochaetia bacterium]|jgi:D-methionine transport system substrate-binding protein|nr:MetQ/NlpA family ABC transporter substrate-binding protein [Spirochaetia bacterium]
MNRKALALSILWLIATISFAQTPQRILKVGATPVPHAELLRLIEPDLAAQGIRLQLVEFTDYVTPNIALAEGQLDANFFQHVPYLESFSAERKLSLEVAGIIHVEPLGIYSKKYHSLSDLPQGASIAIPNDPTNEGRALLLLASKGLITLKPDAGLKATLREIASNPRKFKFKELDAAQLPRTLRDVDASVINGNYAIPAGLNPVKDAIAIEGAESPYANIIAVRKGDTIDPRIVALVAALRSTKVRDFILASYGGGVVPAF